MSVCDTVTVAPVVQKINLVEDEVKLIVDARLLSMSLDSESTTLNVTNTKTEVIVREAAAQGPQGPPGPAGNGEDLEEHILSVEPHPAYDDMPDMKLIFENGLL